MNVSRLINLVTANTLEPLGLDRGFDELFIDLIEIDFDALGIELVAKRHHDKATLSVKLRKILVLKTIEQKNDLHGSRTDLWVR